MVEYYTSELVFVEDHFEEGWFLGVEGDSIVSYSKELPPSGSIITNFGSFAIFPGCVNTHTHSFQSFLRGKADGRNLGDWLNIVYSSAQNLGEEECYLAALISFGEMLKSGVTTVADFFYLNGKGNQNTCAVIQAALDLGIRLIMGRTFLDAEWGGPAAAESLITAESRFREIQKTYARHEKIIIAPAPHSIYGASREMIEAASNLAAEFGTKWFMHLADSRTSAEKIAKDYGNRSVELLHEWKVLTDAFVGIHAMWLSDEEITLLGQAGACISHNPASNMMLGERIIDLPLIWASGIQVGLGTDGAASNNGLNIFRDARLAALCQTVRAGDPQVIQTRSILNMITSDGGSVVGLPIGRLETGYKADFMVIDIDDLSLQPRSTLASNLVRSMTDRAIVHVYCGNEHVVKDGKLVNLDEKEIVHRARKYCT